MSRNRRTDLLIRRGWLFFFPLLALALTFSSGGWSSVSPASPPIRAEELPAPLLGDYAGELREPKPRADGIRHIDTPRTIRKLKELGVNTYFYLIWHASTDWDDLRREFLPAAREAGIDVWVYLVPPSEARSQQSEPYGTDFVSWFRAVGRVSRSFKNLKGIVIDDFNHNFSFFSSGYVKRMRAAGAAMNPRLRFYPQIYYSAIHPTYLKRYAPHIDGVVMTFRDGKFRNTQRTRHLKTQINRVSHLLSRMDLPFILMVHASKLSATPANPSVQYVKESLGIGMDSLAEGKIQGLVTYVLQKEWFPEQKDQTAQSGYGYGCLFIPPGRTPLSGVNGELKQIIRPDGSGDYRLTFSHLDVYPHNLGKGQYVKQVQIDGRVVWQEDVTRGRAERWERKEIDLSSALKGKKEAVLSLRLLRKRTDSSAWLYTGFDSLSSRGFTLEDPGFETGRGWTAFTNHPSIIADIIQYDPKRRLRVYLTTMILNNAFLLFDDARRTGDFPLADAATTLLKRVTENLNDAALQQLNDLDRLLAGSDDHLSESLQTELTERSKKLARLLRIRL
ncbi:hypothetical protein [Salinithrix halophila]|uniref:Uncharacterized protein n=1 Tax=Salinithrix halophila TaxID=1485204 RepID=A0ABV8JFZ7_9BACL